MHFCAMEATVHQLRTEVKRLQLDLFLYHTIQLLTELRGKECRKSITAMLLCGENKFSL